MSKKTYSYFISILTFFLILLGTVLSAPLGAAQSDAAKAAIASGVAAGTDISAILKNAVADGMTIDDAVSEIVTAGGDPGRVVYEALIAKYSSKAVVKGAAAAALNKCRTPTTIPPTTDCSSQISAVISAAQQAGETPGDINGWLADAGVPATLIASANTQSSQSSAPVEGYTATTGGGALTSITGGGGVVIGGSSIGSPTQKASRTNP